MNYIVEHNLQWNYSEWALCVMTIHIILIIEPHSVQAQI